MRFPFAIERGVRFADQPARSSASGSRSSRRGRPVLVTHDLRGAGRESGQPAHLVGEPAKSAIFAPLVVGEDILGVISLQNLDRERAFDDRDVSLLTTIAASLGVALRTGRLIDETRQRVAELGTINSVGRGDQRPARGLRPLLELVGEKTPEAFDADIAYVALVDEEAGMIDFPYYVEGGEHHATGAAAARRRPHLEGARAARAAAPEPRAETGGARGAGPGRARKSWLGVPIMAGDHAIGVISVQSTSQEGRFGDADARLLSTIAANVGVAVQNARLYGETRAPGRGDGRAGRGRPRNVRTLELSVGARDDRRPRQGAARRATRAPSSCRSATATSCAPIVALGAIGARSSSPTRSRPARGSSATSPPPAGPSS